MNLTPSEFTPCKIPHICRCALSMQDLLVDTRHYPANIRLDEYVLKKSFLFVFKRRLDEDEYVLINHTSSEVVFIGLQDVLVETNILVEVFKTSRKSQMPWRHLLDVLKTYHQVKLFLLTSLWEVFNMFVRRTAKTVVYRRIHLGPTSDKFMVKCTKFARVIKISQVLVAYRGVFRTWSNIYNGAFLRKHLTPLNC